MILYIFLSLFFSSLFSTLQAAKEIYPLLTEEDVQLFFADIKMNQKKIIEEKITNNPRYIETRNQKGLKPIHYAVHLNRITILQILLNHGAKINTKTKRKNRALHIARHLGELDIVHI